MSARSFNPTDAYAIMNLLVHQATGQSDISVADTSSFISAGETVLSTGKENVLDSIGIVVGRLLVASRPYDAKLQLINSVNTEMYTNRLRKISYYSRDNEASGAFNTNLYTNLATGFDNGSNGGTSVASMWEQNLPVVLEMNFAGSDVWDCSQTITMDQLKVAFRGEDEFMQFMAGAMQEKMNDIASTKEAFNRMVLLNKIAATIDMASVMPNSAVNLTAAFNARYATNYTSKQLRTTYLADFLKFFVAEFKLASDYMTNRSANYHWSPAKTVGETSYKLLRHTPKDKQRAILYSPLFTQAEANVLPEIFNPQYLALDNYEGVTYWQSINDPSAIHVTPAVPDYNGTTGQQKAGADVDQAYIVGILYDVDGLMTDMQLEDATSTPVEARKKYYNIWYHYAKNGIVDNTENTIVFYMAD